LTNFLKALKHQTWFHLTSRSRVFPSGQTDGRKEWRRDRHDESNSRFRYFANTSKIFEVVLSAAV